MDSRIPKFRKHLKKHLQDSRYEHSLSVSFTCVCLAMRYGCSLDQAELAGLLHDCGKRYDDECILKHCKKHGIVVTADEKKAPAVLHAKYGAWLARNRYEVQDTEILEAIACHSTGKPNMSLLDKILYVSDYIEARRDKAPRLPQLRQLAFEDLDEALYQILKGTLAYLKQKNSYINPMTLETFRYYDNLRKERSI